MRRWWSLRPGIVNSKPRMLLQREQTPRQTRCAFGGLQCPNSETRGGPLFAVAVFLFDVKPYTRRACRLPQAHCTRPLAPLAAVRRGSLSRPSKHQPRLRCQARLHMR